MHHNPLHFALLIINDRKYYIDKLIEKFDHQHLNTKDHGGDTCLNSFLAAAAKNKNLMPALCKFIDKVPDEAFINPSQDETLPLTVINSLSYSQEEKNSLLVLIRNRLATSHSISIIDIRRIYGVYEALAIFLSRRF